ncbi:MAG TPA: hypothetical protein VFE18_08640 [Phenylobacterium sp.]|jgi:hypothetical protein|uniref:hypothetical protein n=1 Tax=Phenylobacterium sp. TaxID=1871053 RepID=UPI002D25CCE7|nr:hypothetical protein [Phenylobacterium sp.]HZZ68228.1 hypothetical protein [Phenylobacterium sp.]
MLGELAEHALVVAKDLSQRMRGCEDTGEAVALADAFQKVSRVVRLTLALDFKLDRDAARDDREAAKLEAEQAQVAAAQTAVAERPAPRAPTPIEARKERVGNLLYRVLWNESEGDTEEFDILQEDLRVRLDEAALHPDFADLPIEVLARRIVADMGLSGDFTLSLSEPPPQATLADGPAPAAADTG